MTDCSLILQHLRRQAAPVSVANVARATGLSAWDTRQALHDLVGEGWVRLHRTKERGEWFEAVRSVT